jgi:NADH:ubiquinone oxidoreductase subunit F (NADH-binding)
MTDSLTLPHPAMAAGGPPPGLPGPGLPRLLPDAGTVPVDLRAHLARHGPLRTPGGRNGLLREVAAAGLTGRGGAAFPAARKLAAAAEARPAPVVVGNGAEGERASSKDRSLLWISPHLVLDGLQLAAGAAGSRSAALYVPRNERLHGRLTGAIAERAAAGMDAATVELVTAPDRFLAGEESALVSRLAGRPALPAYRPVRGLPRLASGRAALVQNVETLAHLALIARYGAAWFREAGTEAEPGSMLTTLHLADGRTSVTEVPLGAGLAGLLGLDARSGPAGPGAAGAEVPLGTSLAGLLGPDGMLGPAEAGAAGPCVPSAFGPVQAVLVGGYHGAWLPAGQAAALPLANAALRPLGAAVGAGVLAALPADRCGLAETARVARYLALESAGQCGPCFNGLPRIAAAVAHLAGPRPDPRARADLERWAGLVTGRGACHHPDGSVRFIRSALRVFAAEAGLHGQGRCSGTDPRPFLPVPATSPATEEDWS